jgi:hypothetical protein
MGNLRRSSCGDPLLERLLRNSIHLFPVLAHRTTSSAKYQSGGI